LAEREWTVREVLAWTTGHFEKKGVPSARLNAELLLAEVLKLPARLELLLEPERKLTDAERAAYREHVSRRAAREPTAHILGTWGFYKRDFALSPEVLTPRSETELVADRAVSWARGAGAKLAADVGAGSGCLAITLALEVPALRVLATEISADALKIARRNAGKLGAAERVEFLEGDLLEPLGTGKAEPGTLDMIVSNPPYIPTADIAELMPEIAEHEPRAALDGGADGLDFYRRLAPECARWLRPGGAVILEIGEGQGGAVTELFAAVGEYQAPEVARDLSDLERIFFALRK
jgi:release factor glutamine methyltransferase